MVVIKKDGSRQSFDRNKVLGSMLRACEKRTVPLAKLEQMTDEIEQTLQNNLEREITTDMVGEQVMEMCIRDRRTAYYIKTKVPVSPKSSL